MENRVRDALAFIEDIGKSTMHGPMPAATVFELWKHAATLASEVARLRARETEWDAAGHAVPVVLDRAEANERRAREAERALWMHAQTDQGQELLKLREQLAADRVRIAELEGAASLEELALPEGYRVDATSISRGHARIADIIGDRLHTLTDEPLPLACISALLGAASGATDVRPNLRNALDDIENDNTQAAKDELRAALRLLERPAAPTECKPPYIAEGNE